MKADILIIGQGLAGTLLAWELERAGVSFVVVDAGHAGAATRAAAGIVNPITGRRLVPSWRIETLRPEARRVFGELESELGVALWREMRVRRLFADGRERAALAGKRTNALVASYVDSVDEKGFWIRDAARVDLPLLLEASRRRWRAMGRLREGLAVAGDEVRGHELVIDCRGLAVASDAAAWSFVPWERLKGEMLEVAVEGLAADVILNRRHWIVPVSAGGAWVGATQEPGADDAGISDRARVVLESSARDLLEGREFTVTGQRAGVRVTLPDKRPVAGRHPRNSRLGMVNGLGSKGVLWAPLLARQWVDHLTRGAAFDAEIDVRHFAHGAAE